MKALWAGSLAALLGGGFIPAFAAGPDTLPPVEAVPVSSAPAGAGWGTADGGHSGGLYGSADYLVWWMKQTPLPPLVTRGDLTANPNAGILGAPGTEVVFGGNSVGGQPFSGGRVTLGASLGGDPAFGIEGTFLFFEQRSTLFSASEPSDGRVFVGQPFQDIGLTPVRGNVLPVSGAGLTGAVDASVLQRLYGAEANARVALGGDGLCLSLLGGFRFLAEDEGLNLATDSTDLAGFRSRSAESFTAHNRFYGGQVGAVAGWRSGSGLAVEVVGKIALGCTDEVVNIHGTTVNSDPFTNTTVSAPVSLLAQGSNSGHHDRNEFAVVPEVGVKVGYQLSDQVTVTVGYSLLYLSALARPGEQIDLATTAPVVGAPATLAHPAFLNRSSDFWAQGVSFGLEFRY
jgi:hypothetical protein